MDPHHISLELLTPQGPGKQTATSEMFAVAGVPSDDNALEKDGPNVPNPIKRRRFEDCNFLDDYDDELLKLLGRQTDACRSLCDAVKEEYDVWLWLHEIRAVDPMEWWKMHNTQFPTIQC